LGIALSRTGRKSEAEKEFAIQKGIDAAIDAAIDARKNTRPEDLKPQ
jgi:hypothetical protein